MYPQGEADNERCDQQDPLVSSVAVFHGSCAVGKFNPHPAENEEPAVFRSFGAQVFEMTAATFGSVMKDGYSFKGASIRVGGPMQNGLVPEGTSVAIPLRTMNRHGLICGATGSGKTKTLQVIAEQLSLSGVPVLLMDVK